MTRFCTRTKRLTEVQNKKYAKDLKEFAKQEVKKFLQEESEENQQKDSE